jgi:4-aminobutyrate aminotransferase-like enzyme
MVAELIQGEGGFNVGDKKILQDIAKCLKKHDILFFVDEVQSFARTYKPFAFQMFELDEYIDLVCVGKSTQVCATIFKEDVKPRPGLVSQTFTGATSSLFAADVVLTEILKGKFYDKKSKTGPELYKIGKNHKYFNLFESGLKNSEFVSNIGGIGAMFAFQVFDGSPDVTMKFVHELFKNGVISFIAGKNPTKVRFLFPTPVMSKKDIDEVVKITLDTLIQFDHDRSSDK